MPPCGAGPQSQRNNISPRQLKRAEEKKEKKNQKKTNKNFLGGRGGEKSKRTTKGETQKSPEEKPPKAFAQGACPFKNDKGKSLFQRIHGGQT